MKKISQGKYEIFTTREDAIDKFMQLQGVCREEISGENAIQFYCTEDGTIIISNPPRKYSPDNSTDLFAEIIEENSKTYVSYYTRFSKSNIVYKYIFYTICIIVWSIAVIFSIAKANIFRAVLYTACLVFFGLNFGTASQDEKNSPKDSEILIKELEKRVNAVNLWDK